MNPNPPSDPPPILLPSTGYKRLDAYILANLVQLETLSFCRRHLSRDTDPCGRQFDQMTQAARSGVKNITEGCERLASSSQTALKLLDVAKASLCELRDDLLTFLLDRSSVPWSNASPEARAVFATPLAKPAFAADIERASAAHVLAQYDKFARWLDSSDPLVAARAMLVLAARAILMLSAKIDRTHADFLANGGFAENLSRERIAARAAAPAPKDAPACPECGKPMHKRLAKRGPRAGHPFWSCPDYPKCPGTRSAD